MTNDDIVASALQNWAKYMALGGVKTGFPSMSPGFLTGGSSSNDSFNHICEGLDLQAGEIMEILVYELPTPCRLAVNHRWLDTQKPTQYDFNLQSGYQLLFVQMNKRGLI
jgi:hypothetical protein